MGSGLWALWLFFVVFLEGASPQGQGGVCSRACRDSCSNLPVSGVPGFQQGGKSTVLNHPMPVPFTVGPCRQAFDHLSVVHRVVGLLVRSGLRKTLGTSVSAVSACGGCSITFAVNGKQSTRVHAHTHTH